jgi:hypothetical protein
MPSYQDEALHLFARASPALRRYVAHAGFRPPRTDRSNPIANQRTSVVDSVETASLTGDSDARPTKNASRYPYSPMVRTVPGRAT